MVVVRRWFARGVLWPERFKYIVLIWFFFFFNPITGPARYSCRVKCRRAFLFSIVNPHGLEPRTLPVLETQNRAAMHCKSEYGPTFGDKYDLHISRYANRNKNSCNIFSSYSCPEGKQTTFFTGATHFTVSNYEVFGLKE